MSRQWMSGAPLGAVVAMAMLSTSNAAGQVSLHVTDLQNRPVDPFAVPPRTQAIVFLFTSVDCPISNRYAPAVRRLHESYAARGVSLSLVYPNPAESPRTIERHVREYGYPLRALRDPKHDLVRFSGATITPEAVVYDAGRRLVYRGRIDDRYVSLGVERPAARQHDLADALAAVLSGRKVREATTRAVGCFIADMAPR